MCHLVYLRKKREGKAEMDLNEDLKRQKALSQFVKGIDRGSQATHNYASKHEEDEAAMQGLVDPTVPKRKQQPPPATRLASKIPFYQKNRAQWWKGKKNV